MFKVTFNLHGYATKTDDTSFKTDDKFIVNTQKRNLLHKLISLCAE